MSSFYTRQTYPKLALYCFGCGKQQRSQWDRTVARWYCEYCGSTIVCPVCMRPLDNIEARCQQHALSGAADISLTGEAAHKPGSSSQPGASGIANTDPAISAQE